MHEHCNPEFCVRSQLNPLDVRQAVSDCSVNVFPLLDGSHLTRLLPSACAAVPSSPPRKSTVPLSLLVLNDRGRYLWSRNVRAWVTDATQLLLTEKTRWDEVRSSVRENLQSNTDAHRNKPTLIVEVYRNRSQLLKMMTSSG